MYPCEKPLVPGLLELFICLASSRVISVGTTISCFKLGIIPLESGVGNTVEPTPPLETPILNCPALSCSL